MDLTKTNACLVNACVGGGWYPAGSDRLARSLNYVGWAGRVRIWPNSWPNDLYSKESGYYVKPSALSQAISEGNEVLLWCDSSVWAIKDPMPLFDLIADQGYFFWGSGYNCAQTCNDRILDHLKLSRDTVESWPDVSSSIFGFDLRHGHGQGFWHLFSDLARNRMFDGSRDHDNQSQDPRFLFHRQDQSAASLAANMLGLKIQQPGEMCQYWQPELNESVIFTLRGL